MHNMTSYYCLEDRTFEGIWVSPIDRNHFLDIDRPVRESPKRIDLTCRVLVERFCNLCDAFSCCRVFRDIKRRKRVAQHIFDPVELLIPLYPFFDFFVQNKYDRPFGSLGKSLGSMHWMLRRRGFAFW